MLADEPSNLDGGSVKWESRTCTDLERESGDLVRILVSEHDSYPYFLSHLSYFDE